MINLKPVLYSLLSDNITVSGGVHTWADGQEVREWNNAFPQITFERISVGETQGNGTRVERFQISCWDSTQKNADDLAYQVVSLLNRSGPNEHWKSCSFVNLAQTYDPRSKTHGVHADFKFVISDQTF